MKYLRVALGVILALSLSRFIPHPPNFTSLIALSFYVPVLFGLKFIPFVILSFIITDIFIGFHSLLLFTWGSVGIIGLISRYLNFSSISRISGALIGSFIFYIITNFGVWVNGMYGHDLEGLIACYTLAIPFFAYNIISTLLFSAVIETFYSFKTIKKFLILIK